MEIGAALTRATVWLALVLYVSGQAALARGHPRPARGLDTFGAVAFLAHVVCAFHYYHHWSHAAAAADTARQTAAVMGWNWGGGLYFNYIFAVMWVVQVVRSWIKETTQAGWITWMVRGFFLLMIVNGAFVFVHGPIKWLGAVLCVVLVACWMWPRPAHRAEIQSQ